jgi:hypothetical protein
LLNILLVLGHELANLVSHLDNSLDAQVQQRNFILYGLSEIIEAGTWADAVVVDLNGRDLVCGLT